MVVAFFDIVIPGRHCDREPKAKREATQQARVCAPMNQMSDCQTLNSIERAQATSRRRTCVSHQGVQSSWNS